MSQTNETDYVILKASSVEKLQKKVIKYLENGYILTSGHQVTPVSYINYTNRSNTIAEISPNKREIIQAMYKLEQKQETKQKVMI